MVEYGEWNRKGAVLGVGVSDIHLRHPMRSVYCPGVTSKRVQFLAGNEISTNRHMSGYDGVTQSVINRPVINRLASSTYPTHLFVSRP
jgi:hypothetical protein